MPFWKFIILANCYLLISYFCNAQSIGPLSPSTESDEGPGAAWTLGNAATSNNLYDRSAQMTSDGSTTNFLKVSNFGFSIPTSSAIKGIQVNIERNYTGGLSTTSIQDFQIYLIKNGVLQTGTNKALAVDWPENTDGIASYGGVADLWGNTWTVSDINASGFGVAISARRFTTPGSPAFGNVDHVTVTVSYISTLPVLLNFFEARVINETKTEIRWSTYLEEKLSHFVAEHSVDGVIFYPLYSIQPGAGSSEKTYKVIHHSPARNTNFYRLKIVDIDGRFEYSVVRKVDIVVNEKKYNVFYNNRQLYVDIYNPDGAYEITIFDLSGHQLGRFKLYSEREDIHKIFSFQTPIPGVYIVNIRSRFNLYSRAVFLHDK